MKRGLLIGLAAILALSTAGCSSGKAQATLNGKNITLSNYTNLGELYYNLSDDFELIGKTTGYDNRTREYRLSNNGKDFWIFIAEKSSTLHPMQDEIDAISADPENKNCEVTTKTVDGRQSTYVTFDTNDPAHGGNVTKHYCYVIFEDFGLRYFYRIEFINCTEDTKSFEDVFLSTIKTT